MDTNGLLRRRMLLSMIGTAFAFGHVARAQGRYPDRPIKLVVASEPGSTPDILARAVAFEMGPALGKTVIVENRSGAAGTIGAASVATAANDGYTILLGGLTNMVLAPLIKPLRYDPAVSFTPLGQIAEAPILLVASPKLGVQGFADLGALARQRELSFSSPGVGGLQHLAGMLLQKAMDVRLLHVPYKSGSAAATAVASGEVDLGFVGVPVVTSLVGAGKIQPLFITSLSRSPLLPTVPTASEVGLANFAMDNWNAVFGPASLPNDVVVALDRALDAAMASASVRDQFVRAGVEPRQSTGKELATLIAGEKYRWADIIKTSGVKVE